MRQETMLIEIDETDSLVSSIPLPACPGCRMVKNEWPGEGYTHDGETYCCQGCAEGTGCMCLTVGKSGFSRRGQRLTRAEPRPVDWRVPSLVARRRQRAGMEQQKLRVG